jgi:hypothetical protein
LPDADSALTQTKEAIAQQIEHSAQAVSTPRPTVTFIGASEQAQVQQWEPNQDSHSGFS